MIAKLLTVPSLVVAALAVVVAGGVGIESLTSLHATATVTNTGLGLVHWNNLSGMSNKGSYSVVIGGTAEAAMMRAYPGRKLVYYSAPDVNRNYDTGVPWSTADANGWLLKDASGNLLVNQGYPANNIGDVGSPGYQQAWIANVLAFLGAHPWLDGVHIDDVDADIAELTGVEAAKYPTWQDWEAAQRSFVAAVGTALQAHGYYVMVNAVAYVPGNPGTDDGSLYADWFRQLAPYVNGISDEAYAATPDDYTLRSNGSGWTQHWDGWQQLIPLTQSLGVDFIAYMHGSASDTRAMSYGKASFLLEWNGGGSTFIYSAGDVDTWNPAWTTDIGQPAGAKQQVGVGWMRPYTAGVALVNPSPSSSQTFELGGSYLDASGATVTSVTLAPTTGAILESTTPPPVTPPATTPTTTDTTQPTATTTTTPATTDDATTTISTPPATTTAATTPATTEDAATTTSTPPPTDTAATTPGAGNGNAWGRNGGRPKSHDSA